MISSYYNSHYFRSKRKVASGTLVKPLNSANGFALCLHHSLEIVKALWRIGGAQSLFVAYHVM